MLPAYFLLILGCIAGSLPVPAGAEPPAATRRHAAEQGRSVSLGEIKFATIAAIRDNRQIVTTAHRIRAAQPIIVMEYSSLHAQALALNRVAALVEKQNAPRDRILTPTEIQRFIRSEGVAFDRFYDGHDYRAADIARFFSIAARDRVPLNREEARLQTMIVREKWGRATAGALISIPPLGHDIDRPARNAIMQHELSHAAYFTDPGYAALAKEFWTRDLSGPERTAVRYFLSSQDYDRTNDDLMINEAQAYLFNTPDSRFFTPGMLGMTNERYAELRLAFLPRIPGGWFRDFVMAPPGE